MSWSQFKKFPLWMNSLMHLTKLWLKMSLLKKKLLGKQPTTFLWIIFIYFRCSCLCFYHSKTHSICCGTGLLDEIWISLEMLDAWNTEVSTSWTGFLDEGWINAWWLESTIYSSPQGHHRSLWLDKQICNVECMPQDWWWNTNQIWYSLKA